MGGIRLDVPDYEFTCEIKQTLAWFCAETEDTVGFSAGVRSYRDMPDVAACKCIDHIIGNLKANATQVISGSDLVG